MFTRMGRRTKQGGQVSAVPGLGQRRRRARAHFSRGDCILCTEYCFKNAIFGKVESGALDDEANNFDARAND